MNITESMLEGVFGDAPGFMLPNPKPPVVVVLNRNTEEVKQTMRQLETSATLCMSAPAAAVVRTRTRTAYAAARALRNRSQRAARKTERANRK